MRGGSGDFRLRLLSGGSLAAHAFFGVVLSSVAPNVALAEDAQIEDVKVSSGASGEQTRRQEQAQKQPREIVVVTPKTAQREQLERLSDFAQKVPNYKVDGGHPLRAATIRGVGLGAGTGAGSEQDTGFILDNVFWKNVGFQWGDFVDLESFELGLGPQGTAYGKNTTVGAAIIRTQLPSFERKATFETSFANYNRIIEKLNVTGPVIDDKLAYRVAFYLDKGDGWIRDQATGAGYLNNDRWGARGQLLYVGEDVTDRLIFNYGRSNEYSNTGACQTTLCAFSDSFQVFANGTRPASTYVQTLFNRLGRSVLTLDPYKPYFYRTPTFYVQQHTVSNELNWNIGENTLTSISAYGHYRLQPRVPLGNQELSIIGVRSDNWVDQFSQELRLSSPKDRPLEWVTGVYSLYEYAWNRNLTEFGSDAALWFNRPALKLGMENDRDGKSRTFQLAAYGQATYRFDDQLALTFGLRDSYETKEGSVFSWHTLYPSAQFSAADQIAAIRAGGGQAIFDTGGVSKSLNSLTGIFNPQYKFNENIVFHALVGRGEKAGAVNTAAGVILDGNNFKAWQPVITKPEVSWDYEAGVKTTWLDGALVANFNLYWNDLYNFQTNLVDASYSDSNGQPIRSTYLGTAPHARLRGFEFDGRWNAAEGLWINYSGAYTEARWIDFPNAPIPADWQWTSPANTAPTQLSRSNTRWEFVPLWSLNIGANYERPLGRLFSDLGAWADQSVTGFGYVNVSWRDKTRLTDPHSVFQYWVPSYTLVNFGFGLRTDDERYSLSFWAKNIFDARPIQTWSPGNSTTPATLGWPNDHRTFGGSLLVKLY